MNIMTREQLKAKFPHASETFLDANCGFESRPVPVIKERTRVRQSSKPLMNKLELEYFNILSAQCPNYPRPRPQAKRYRLGNGITFTPDVTASSWPDPMGPSRETAWEIKGAYAYEGALDKLKIAAAVWPEVRWLLVWKQDGKWNEQEIKP